jgi:non-ribosomal peptide synthetase component F
VLHRVWLAVQHDAIASSDRQSLLTHCSFSASESDMFGVLLQGGTLCVFDVAGEGLAAFQVWIDEQRITLLHPPVLLFRNLLATLDGGNVFPSVRLVALAGDVVLPADARAGDGISTRLRADASFLDHGNGPVVSPEPAGCGND